MRYCVYKGATNTIHVSRKGKINDIGQTFDTSCVGYIWIRFHSTIYVTHREYNKYYDIEKEISPRYNMNKCVTNFIFNKNI